MTRRVIVSLAGDFASLHLSSTKCGYQWHTAVSSLRASPFAPPPERPGELTSWLCCQSPMDHSPLGGGENNEHQVFFPTRHLAASFPVFSSLCHSVYLCSFFYFSANRSMIKAKKVTMSQTTRMIQLNCRRKETGTNGKMVSWPYNSIIEW